MRNPGLSRLALVALATLTAGAAACDNSISIDEFPRELEDRYCEINAACGYAPDEVTCHESIFLEENSGVRSLVAAVKRGTVKYDAELARECLDQLGAGCMTSDPAACEATFEGTVATGGTCYSSEECANQASCQSVNCTTSCCAGTCGPARPVIGQACADASGAFCARGAYCNTAGICAALPRVGESCDELGDCEGAAQCVTNASGTRICVARAATGGACNATGVGGCARVDDYCDITTMTCQRRKGPGAACSSTGDECIQYANCVEDVCVAFGASGDACNIPQGLDCHGALVCPAGICAAPAAEAICPP